MQRLVHASTRASKGARGRHDLMKEGRTRAFSLTLGLTEDSDRVVESARVSGQGKSRRGARQVKQVVVLS
jgi:hypothetical protein